MSIIEKKANELADYNQTNGTVEQRLQALTTNVTNLQTATTSNTISSNANNITSIVNGTSSTAPIINSVITGIASNVLTTTVNGVSSTVTLPTSTPTPSNLALGTVTATTQPVTNSNGTGFTLPSSTTSTAGLMSATDKTKLDALSTTPTFVDNTFQITDNVDPTKIMNFELSGLTTATTSTKTMKAPSGTIPQENTANTYSQGQTFTGTQTSTFASGGTINNIVSSVTNTNTTNVRADVRAYRVNLTPTANTNPMSNFLDGFSYGTTTPATNNIIAGHTFGTTGNAPFGYDFFLKYADTTRGSVSLPTPFATCYIKANGEAYFRYLHTSWGESANGSSASGVLGQTHRVGAGVNAGNHGIILPNHTLGGNGNSAATDATINGNAFWGAEITIMNDRVGAGNTVTITPTNGTLIAPITQATVRGGASYVLQAGEVVTLKYHFGTNDWKRIRFTTV